MLDWMKLVANDLHYSIIMQAVRPTFCNISSYLPLVVGSFLEVLWGQFIM